MEDQVKNVERPGKDLKKKLLWTGALLFALVILLSAGAALLLLGKAEPYPKPVLGFDHLKVMSRIGRKYAKIRKREKKSSAYKPVLKLNEKETDTLIAIGESVGKKEKDLLKWRADFLQNGMLEIRFSRHLAAGLALNGRLILTVSYEKDKLNLKIKTFKLGRLSLDPALIQEDLDRAMTGLKQRPEYALLRQNVESITVSKGHVFVTFKVRRKQSLPINRSGSPGK